MSTTTPDLTRMSAEEKRALAKKLLGERAGRAELRAEIPPEFYRFELHPGYRQLEAQWEGMRRLGIENPYFNCHLDVSDSTITIGEREYIHYSGYNYLGLSGDPNVSAAAKAAIDQYGTSVGASRVASGEIALHRELEQELAEAMGTEASLVFVSGYGTNVSTIAHLCGPKDLILHDALIHNSAVTGCRLSGARRVPFPHNDWQALDKLLAENRRLHERVLIIIEGVYSMDGDIPDLPRFVEVKARHHALLMVDEAHSFGVLGPRGLGLGEHFGVSGKDVDVWMGTMSKSLASCGGYIAGSRPLVEFLKYTAPGACLYSVGISPANAAACLAALRKLRAEPERVARLHARASLFLELARERGLDTGPSAGSPVVPVIIRNSIKCLQVADGLFQRSINVQPMLHPAVPEDAARLRFFITAAHTEEQIRYTADALAELNALHAGATA